MSKKQQFQFEANQSYQIDAIESVVELFDGLGKTPDEYRLGDEIFANLPEGETLDEQQLFENLLSIQTKNNEQGKGSAIEISQDLEIDDGMVLEGAGNDSVRVPNFTIEMETGTGKTYVYFRTLHELNQHYGFKKFIIVVPSIAIYEGVVGAFHDTKSHFASLYNNEVAQLIEYDGSALGKIRDFATAQVLTIMVMTRDSFNKTSNNFYKATEKLQGERKPYQWVQETRPIVILDEPQNINTEKANEAIRTLNPLFVLRYSATHRVTPNTVYRLTPVDAFRHGLVKQIEVIGISQLDNLNVPLLRLEEITRNPITAKVRALEIKNGQTREQTFTLKQGSDLHKLSGRAEYKGYVVSEIRISKKEEESDVIEFENGEIISYHDEVIGSREEVFRAQIEKTIETHFQRQHDLKKDGIKVLSLFFIDRVANYTNDDGLIKTLFDQAYNRLKKKYPDFAKYDAHEVRKGYFAKSKGVEVDLDNIANKDKAAAEKEAYKLIMTGKKQLLRFDEPVSFIFAHSALKEGWDNPNVFQICTLNNTHSKIKKRQEIGRGLRLCVDQELKRIKNADINVLTVIANESYESFVGSLQKEYTEDGYGDGVPMPKKPEDSVSKRNNKLYNSKEFKEFWMNLNRKMTYQIDVDTSALIESCIKKLNESTFPQPALLITKGQFVIREYTLKLESATEKKARIRVIHRDTQGGSSDTLYPLDIESDLAKVARDDNLRGFKIMEIAVAPQESKVKFTNGISISIGQPHTFSTEKTKKSEPTHKEVSEHNYPLFDIIGRVAAETNLTRKTVLEIFKGIDSRQKETLLKNPEGWTGHFLTITKNVLCDHIAERIVFVPAANDEVAYEDCEELFPPATKIPQKELIGSGARGLYDRVQIDSDVERDFVRDSLIPDEENVLLYFKFPPKFKIELPKIIGQYNPDWGIVRRAKDGQLSLQLVRETKGRTDLDQLRFPQEKRKIVCAKRHFATLGIRYRVVTGDTPHWWEDSESEPVIPLEQTNVLEFVPLAKRKPWKNCIPLVSDIAVAAGYWSDEQYTHDEMPEWATDWVAIPDGLKVERGMFVVRISGNSMHPLVSDGDWCIFRPAPAGARNGKRLLIWHVGNTDPDTGSAYTFKEYYSEKAVGGEQWQHTKITLKPLNPEYKPITLTAESEGNVRVIGEFVRVIQSPILES